jgi:Xaa-Pro aminopeptidase
MFQTFTAATSPDQGPPRLAALRAEMRAEGLDAFIVPRADAHQGEYVALCDERLAWLTGFTGSAGFAVVTADEAGVFIDGRYRLQVRGQVAKVFTPVDWPATKPGPWLADKLNDGAKVGFDPWLHTAEEIERLKSDLGETRLLVPSPNLIDRIWKDRPSPPEALAFAHPIEFAGESSREKCQRLADILKAQGQKAAVLTLPDSICWLLNIRGNDVARNPVVQAFAILHDDAKVSLFGEPRKFDVLGPDPAIAIAPGKAFADALSILAGPIRVDKATAPLAVPDILRAAGIEVVWGEDPCILPKARKNASELKGMRDAHLRDAAAMVRFLAWLDREAPKGGVSEIDAVKALEGYRRATNSLREISFETISGSGPNGAIVHYRVTENTNRALRPGELYLVDSGGQYPDGTTDITRTVIIGAPNADQRDCFTRVLQGMIAISTARFPRGLAGRDLDALARAPLWRSGYDYDHGTGHGVGAYLSVHEGPQRISRASDVPLEEGMILSNEPGYYREGAFGIRIENLIVVSPAPKIGDGRDQLCFETLTYVPIDRRLIDAAALAPWERAWIDVYHREVLEKVGRQVEGTDQDWLVSATEPLPYA